MSDYTDILYSIDNGVATIAINRAREMEMLCRKDTAQQALEWGHSRKGWPPFMPSAGPTSVVGAEGIRPAGRSVDVKVHWA
jgi:hypothetical protein